MYKRNTKSHKKKEDNYNIIAYDQSNLLLKESFISEEIVHHGKPKWLGRQHVDVWFPKRKIGVEYQGLQHDKPVEYFGGKESYLKGKERDERKKQLFKENNSILIEVRKGYELEDIIKEIKKNF